MPVEPPASRSVSRRRFLIGAAAAGAAVLGVATAGVLRRPRGRIGWNRDAPWVGARREYFRGPFSTEDLVDLSAGGVRPVVSYKPDRDWAEVAAGDADADLDAMHAALLHSGIEADVAFHHEPENDELGHEGAVVSRGTAEDYVAAASRFADRVTSGTESRYLLCLMSSGYEEAPERWECGAEQAYAVDTYNQFGARGDVWRSLRELITPMADHARGRGLPSGVWECNTMEDPADADRKAAWITDAATAAEELQLETLLFFDGGDYAWSLLSSSEAEAAVERAAALDYFDA